MRAASRVSDIAALWICHQFVINVMMRVAGSSNDITTKYEIQLIAELCNDSRP